MTDEWLRMKAKKRMTAQRKTKKWLKMTKKEEYESKEEDTGMIENDITKECSIRMGMTAKKRIKTKRKTEE